MPRDDAALWLEFCAHCDRIGRKPREIVFDMLEIYLEAVKAERPERAGWLS